MRPTTLPATFSPNSTSRRGGAAILAAILAVVSGGCAGRPAAPVAAARPAKPARVFVSLDRLAPRHPLYPDLVRLDAVVRRLEQPARSGGGAAEQAAPLAFRALPALTLPAPVATAGAAAGGPVARLRTLGRMQRTALAVRLEALDAAETRRRRESLTAARRAVQIEGRAQRAAEAEAAYRRRLESALSGGYVRDYANRRIKIAALESAVQASIVPEHRTHFEERLAQARAALAVLEAAEAHAQQEARRAADDVLEAAAQSDEGVLEATLRAERERANRRTRLRLTAEARALDQDLIAVRAQIAALARSGRAGAPSLPARGAGPSGPPQTGGKSAAATVAPRTLARTRAQRDRLRAALLADLRAWVQTTARARNVGVTFSPTAAAPDRTGEFSRWLDADGRANAVAASS